jgi:hypothetical protein
MGLIFFVESEVRGRKSEVRSQKAEGRSGRRKAEGGSGRQNAERGRQKGKAEGYSIFDFPFSICHLSFWDIGSADLRESENNK